MGKTRRANYDILRVVLMLQMIALHYLHVYDLMLTPGTGGEPLRYAGMLLEIILIITGNNWLLLSGYLRVNSSFKPGRVLEILFSVVFYGAGIWMIAYATGFAQSTDGLFGIIQSLFPVSANAYGFMTNLVLVLMLSPVLNAGARALTKKQFQITLLLLLIWNSVIKSVVPVNFASDDLGYGFKWFVCLYLTGAYIRLHMKNPEDETTGEKELSVIRKRSLAFYVAECVLLYAIACGLYLVHETTGRFAYYASVPLHYNYLPVYAGSVAFFLWYATMRIKESNPFALLCVRLSPYVLGAYMLHAHPVLFERWPQFTEAVLGAQPRDNPPLLCVHLVLTVLLVFFCGIAADLLRSFLFRLAGKLFAKKEVSG